MQKLRKYITHILTIHIFKNKRMHGVLKLYIINVKAGRGNHSKQITYRKLDTEMKC